jgi:hypothetical protein
MPAASSADIAISAAQDLIRALRFPSSAAPIAPISDSNLTALKQLAQIFENATATTTAPEIAKITPKPAPPPTQQALPTKPVTTITPPAVSPPRVSFAPATQPRVEPNPTPYPTMTGNPGQRRWRSAKKKQQEESALKQQHSAPAAPPPTPDTTKNPWITVTRAVSRCRRSQRTDAAHTIPIPPGHIAIPSHTANFLFHDKTAQQPTPAEPQSLTTPTETALPPHAYWTANAVINPDTGATVDHQIDVVKSMHSPVDNEALDSEGGDLEIIRAIQDHPIQNKMMVHQ